jgi:hypothetical protein
MEKELIYFALFLILAYVFVLMVLRAVYFTFVLKKEPLQSLNVIPKIKWKTKKGSMLEVAEKEQKAERLSKWG